MGSILRHRLKGSAEFADLFRRGRRLDGACLQLLARRAAGPVGRLGFVVGRKLIRLAVDRNRVRRVVREAIRARRPAIEAYDLIVRVRRTPVLRGRELEREIALLIENLFAEARR